MEENSTILIVDNEQIGRDTLEALLVEQNYDLAFASDGAEALAKAAELTPDLILLDVMMPGMDGFEVCRRLRAHPLLANVPIIMVTALDDRDSRLQGIEAGADDFVSKPFDRVELRARVRTITRLNRYRQLLLANHQLEINITQLSALYDISSTLNSTIDIDVLSKYIIQKAKELLNVEGASIILWDQQRDELYFPTVVVEEEKVENRLRWVHFPTDSGIAGWVFRKGKPALVQDVSADDRFYKQIDKDTGFATRSILCVPLRDKGDTLGVLEVVNKKEGEFTEDDRHLLEAMADNVAVSIGRANLYQDLQEAEALLRHQNAELRQTVEALQIEITERKHAEEASRESEHKYRVLVENANETILVAQDGMLKFVNPKATELMGYSEDELTARPFAEFIHPDEREMVTERHLKRLSGEGFPQVYTFRVTAKDGNIKWVRLNTAIIAWEGRSATLNFLSDITEQKRMESALEEERALLAQRVEERTADLSAANAELARAARLKDEFLANMSHELRTPLNAILGMSEALQEEIYGSLNERQIESLRSVEESGRHLLDLINDILDVSKIEAGKLKLEMRIVSAESVCRASLQLVKQDAQKKRVRVSSSFDSIVTTIQADERRLKQILVNLLNNAVKFTPEGGDIGLEVIGDLEQEAARFIIWDTGIGISQKQMEHLFKPFVQLDSSLSRQYEGAGLGLALVHRLVELHCGSISVESEVGKGSRFTVSLPWQGATEAAKTEGKSKLAGSDTPTEKETTSVVTPDEEPEAGQPLILLVEDNEDSINTVSDYLLAKGYHMAIAWNGSEAMQRVKEEKPDVILMDVQMPGMDGLEAIHHIRADPDLMDIPIIALTALAMPGDRERCLKAGANDYIAKPVSLRGLVKTIEAQLNRNLIEEKNLT